MKFDDGVIEKGNFSKPFKMRKEKEWKWKKK